VKSRGIISTGILLGVVFLLVTINLGAYIALAPLGKLDVGRTSNEENFYAISPTPIPYISEAPIVSLPSPTAKPKAKLTPTPKITPQPSSSSTSYKDGVEVSFKTTYYSIYGETESYLRAEMDAKGHLSDNGERYDGYTNWNIAWNYPYSQTSQGCSSGPISVSVSVEMILPKWENFDSGPESLKSKWNTYISSLTLHENGHKDIAYAGGEEIYNTLSSYGSYSSCNELEAQLDQKGESIRDKVDQDSEAYDAQTNHGATQGATFP